MGAPWVGAPCAARAAALRTRLALASLISCWPNGDTLRGRERALMKMWSLSSGRAVLPPGPGGAIKGDHFPLRAAIVPPSCTPTGAGAHRGQGPRRRPPGAPWWRCATRSNLVALGRAAVGRHCAIIPHQRRLDALAYTAVRGVGMAPPRTGPGWEKPPKHVPAALSAVCGRVRHRLAASPGYFRYYLCMACAVPAGRLCVWLQGGGYQATAYI